MSEELTTSTNTKSCTNCANLDVGEPEEPGCDANCVDFLKQLCSGTTLECREGKEVE